MYALANRAPLWNPRPVPASALDARLPVVPAAVLPYVTYFLLLPALIAWTRHRAQFSRVFGAALVCGLANAATDLVLPTTLAARPAAAADAAWPVLLELLRRLDTPLCALPSGHVALPAAIVVAALLAARATSAARAWRRTAVVYLVWTAILASAALLTGQHYLIDIVAGLGLGAGVALATGPLTAADGAPQPAARRRRAPLHAPSAIAVLSEWAVIGVTVTVALAWWSLPVAVVAGLVVATRQHALLVLYHDAVHGLFARRRRLNDLLANAAVGVPLLLPVHLYRALHISHHRYLGSARDPERLLLYRGQRWNYRPLAAGALAVQLAGDLSGWNAIILAGRYFVARRRGGTLALPRCRAYPELGAQFAIWGALWAGAGLTVPVTALRLAALWFLPYLTLTQLLQKVRSFAEHTDDDDHDQRSCSWAPGLLGRLTVWPYNINYHREHHARPDLPWNRLPAAYPEARQWRGARLRSHLWSGALR